MKQISIGILMTAIMLQLLSGCGSAVQNLKETSYTDAMTDNGMTIQTEDRTYRKGDVIHYFVENHSGEFGNYNHVLRLERYENGIWYQIQYKPNTAFTQPLYGLDDGGRDSLSVSTVLFDYSFPAGHYRVCMEWSEDFSGKKQWNKVSFSEFDIVKRKKASSDDLAAFISKVTVDMPAETEIVLPENGKKATVRFSVLNAGGTYFALDQKKEKTRLFGFIAVDSDTKELLLSNYLDPDEAKEKGYLFEEGIDYVSLGPADEEILRTVSDYTETQKQGNSTRIRMKLDEEGREVFAVESMFKEDVLELACSAPGTGEMLYGLYDTDQFRLIGLRRLTDQSAVVYFTDSSGRTVKKSLDITQKILQDMPED